jgi:hypothetical protein
VDGDTSVQDTRATSVVAANAGEERMTYTAVDVDYPGEATEWSLDRATKRFPGTNP